MGTKTTRAGEAYDALGKMKGLGIVVAIIMILLGICMFIRPLATNAVFMWLMVIAVLVNGIEKIVVFCKTPKGYRSGGTLALGILWILIALLLLSDLCNVPIAATMNLQLVAALLLGFSCIFGGITNICTSGQVAAMGGSAGAAIALGILELLCGCIVMSNPLFSLATFLIVIGIYLVVMGIALLVRCLSIKKN